MFLVKNPFQEFGVPCVLIVDITRRNVSLLSGFVTLWSVDERCAEVFAKVHRDVDLLSCGVSFGVANPLQSWRRGGGGGGSVVALCVGWVRAAEMRACYRVIILAFCT